MEEIKSKVENTVKSQTQLRSKQQRSVEGTSTLPHSNQLEQQFRRQLYLVLQNNLHNAEFSACDFAKAMCMSRMQLHRKLKALTNLSTSIFLRTERLNAAKIMLEKPNAIIAKVAYAVGFSSPSFFSKCFKQQFGTTPREMKDLKTHD